MTLSQIREAREKIAFSWTEFVDQSVIKAAEEAVSALQKLENEIMKMRGI